MEQKNKFYKNILTYKTGKVNAKIPRDKKNSFQMPREHTRHETIVGKRFTSTQKKKHTGRWGVKHDVCRAA